MSGIFVTFILSCKAFVMVGGAPSFSTKGEICYSLLMGDCIYVVCMNVLQLFWINVVSLPTFYILVLFFDPYIVGRSCLAILHYKYDVLTELTCLLWIGNELNFVYFYFYRLRFRIFVVIYIYNFLSIARRM